MVILATLFFLQGAGLVGSMPGAGAPENITIMFLNPNSVKVSWSTSAENIEKYDVTYKPINASYRVVEVVAGNSDAVTLKALEPNTQYQITVTAVRGGKRYRSRPIVFRTMEPPNSSAQRDAGSMATGTPPTASIDSGPPTGSNDSQPYIQVRGVEVGIVLLVLVVWVAAIALFFNRWGKIRMLLPYQPDFKDQLKVPGSGPCIATQGGTCPTQQHSSSTTCPQHHHWSSHQHFDLEQWSGPSSRLINRPRVNSAIYISSSPGAGGRDAEFSRYQPFRSELCRRARSAENIPMSGMSSLPSHHSQYNLNTNAAIYRSVTPTILPVLSVSGPSPSEESEEQIDQHL